MGWGGREWRWGRERGDREESGGKTEGKYGHRVDERRVWAEVREESRKQIEGMMKKNRRRGGNGWWYEKRRREKRGAGMGRESEASFSARERYIDEGPTTPPPAPERKMTLVFETGVAEAVGGR